MSVAKADKPLIGMHQVALYCDGPSDWSAAATDAEYTHAKVSRGSIPWRCVEPKAPVNGVHSYNWSSIDGAINSLNAKGVATVGILDWVPQWSTGSTDPFFFPWTGSQSTWNTFVSSYATYAAAVAKRYKGKNVYYEILNEQNQGDFWHPAPQTNKTLAISRYGQLFTAARNAILTQDASAKVALGGITGLGAGSGIQGIAYIEALMRNNVRFDYAGIHPYDDDSPWTHRQWHDNYDDAVGVYNKLQQYPAYRNVKLWFTETAWYDSNKLGEGTQADYIETIMQRADSGFEGRIPPSVIEMVHIFIDRDHPPISGFGSLPLQRDTEAIGQSHACISHWTDTCCKVGPT
jgi:hypothetical protein